MNQNDHAAIARVICDAQFINCDNAADIAMNTATRNKIALELADLMGQGTGRFDRVEFLKECDVL